MNGPLEDNVHRTLREQLGAYALGHLEPEEAATVRDHLVGCAACRADLAEIEPAVRGLRLVDAEHVDLDHSGTEGLPAGLGGLIRAAVAADQPHQGGHQSVTPMDDPSEIGEPRHRGSGRTQRRTQGWALGVAASLLVAVAFGVGAVVGRGTAPEPVARPTEAIELTAAEQTGVSVSDAELVAHTWGVEVRFVASGFAPGETYDAMVEDSAGTLTSAGQFLGEGSKQITCAMQSAAMRDDTVAFLVLDQSGDVVLTADL